MIMIIITKGVYNFGSSQKRFIIFIANPQKWPLADYFFEKSQKSCDGWGLCSKLPPLMCKSSLSPPCITKKFKHYLTRCAWFWLKTHTPFFIPITVDIHKFNSTMLRPVNKFVSPRTSMLSLIRLCLAHMPVLNKTVLWNYFKCYYAAKTRRRIHLYKFHEFSQQI